MPGQGVRSLALLLLTPLCATLAAQSVCSTRTLVGTWAASSQGIIFATPNPPPIAGPGAAVGLVSIDYDGRISIKLSGNIGGAVGPLEANGAITVNPDCSGELNAVTTGGWTLSEKIVVLGNGNEVRTIAVGGMLRGKPTVWQCWWKRLARVPMPVSGGISTCSNEMIRGTWIGSFDGVILSGEAAPVTAGVLTRGTVDHRQILGGAFTASLGGEVSTGEYSGAVVEVNPDCTGTLRFTMKGADGASLPGEQVEAMVIVDHGQQIWSLPLQGPLGMPIGLTRYERISPVPFQ